MTENIAKADSQYAARMFGREIKWAAGIGQSQVAHFYRNLTEEFGSKTFGGAITLFRTDILERHAELIASGIVDLHEDPGIVWSAVSLPSGEGLSIRFEDGDHMLIAWERPEDDRLELTIIPWKDKAPESLVADMRTLVSRGATRAELAALAQRLGGYSNTGIRPDGTDDLFYSKLPLSIDDIRGFIGQHGLKKTGWVSGLGTYCSTERSYGGVSILSFDAIAHHDGVIEYAEKLRSVFKACEAAPGEPERTAHTIALLDGTLRPLFNSACALSMEFNLNNGLDDLREMVAACGILGLSSEAAFAYGDLDRIIYAERRGGRHLYMHTNIDLIEGCAYGTVLTLSEGGVDRCDVYLADRWDVEDGSPSGSEGAMVIGERAAYHHLENLIRGISADRIGEDRLVEALGEPVLPREGRVFSYDFRTREMEIDTRLASSTGYLDYFRLLTEGDKEALSKAAEGEFGEWGTGFILRSITDGPGVRSRTVEPEEYMTNLKAGVCMPCPPPRP